MMAKRYTFTVSVTFPVHEEMEFCTDDSDNLCDGSCGGECNSYFWDLLRKYLGTNGHDLKAELYSSSISLEEDE